MRSTVPAPAVAGASASHAAFRSAYSPSAASAADTGLSASHVYSPPPIRGFVSRERAFSILRSDSRSAAEVAPAPAYGTTHALASPSRATSGASLKTTVVTEVATQQHSRGEPSRSRVSSPVAGGNSTYSSTWGGTQRTDTNPATASTESHDLRQQMQRLGQAFTPVAAATVQGAGGTQAASPKNTTIQSTHHGRRGVDSVYARSEKIHDMTRLALQLKKGPPSLIEVQRQQQRLLLQEHLPAFFPAAQEGEYSEDGKKLNRVLAFSRCAAITAAAEAASEKNREPLDWRKATVAMAAFGLPQDVKQTIKGSTIQAYTGSSRVENVLHRVTAEDDRWRRAFPRNSLAVRSLFPADSQFYLFMALAAEGSRRFEEAEAYMLRMIVANALRKEEIPAKQRMYMQKLLNRRLRHQRNMWTQTVALEQALQTRQSVVEDRPFSGARLEKGLQLDEVLSHKQRLKSEIVRHCYGVIWTATHLLKPYVVTVAGRVFVHKIIAAAYRQATQYTVSVPQYQCLELARDNYEIAVKLARSEGNLELCDLNRLEVIIGWANFLFYNLKEHKQALQEGRKVLQEALRVLPTIKEDKNFNDAVEALQTLMRSIRCWMQETQQDAVFDWWME